MNFFVNAGTIILNNKNHNSKHGKKGINLREDNRKNGTE